MKKIVLMMIGLGMTMIVSAQTGNVPKYGLDSVSCVENLNECFTLYKEWQNAKLAPESFNPRLLITWREVFLNCPKSSQNIYTRGENIIEHLIRQYGSNNPTVALAYYDTLGMLFDKRAEFFPIDSRTGESQVEHIMERRERVLQIYKTVIKNNEVSQNSGGKDVSPTALKNNDEPVGPNNKYKNYKSLPDIGPIAGEFYVGHCNAKPKPKDPPITGREMSVIWEFDVEKGMIGFSTPQPQGGGNDMVDHNKITFYLANGQQITQNSSKTSTYHRYNSDGTMITRPFYGSYYWIYLPDYNSDQIVVSQINAPEQSGKPSVSGYWTVYNDHYHKINYTLPINVKEAKAYYNFNHAKKGSLKDAIAFVKECNNATLKADVENEILNSKINHLADVVYCIDNYPKFANRLEDKMFGLIGSVSDCEAYLKRYPSSQRRTTIENKMFGLIKSVSDCEAYLKCYPSSERRSAIDDKMYQFVKSSTDKKDCETYLKLFPNGKHASEIDAQKTEIAYFISAIEGTRGDCNTYLQKYPNGRFAYQIRDKIDLMDREGAIAQETWSQRESPVVNESNVMQHVKSIREDKDKDNWRTYEVEFVDGYAGWSGWIEYRKSDGKWGGQDGFSFGYAKYVYPEPNSKAAAILVLYNYLLRLH